MRIVVLYPRGYRSGGPEAIHQLVDEARRQGAEAFVSPLPGTEHAERSDAYAGYDAPEVDPGSIQADDVVVATEASIVELMRAPAGQRVLWWLSVDNAIPAKHTRALTDPFRRKQDLREQGPLRAAAHLVREAGWRRRLRRDRRLLHVAQSAYARDFVERLTGRDAGMLSDYTVTSARDPSVNRSPGRVAYNPAKGGDLVLAALEEVPDVNLLPLRGMDSAQLGRALDSSAVYLDLGHQPGKDRLPREAALHGAVVIVARRGAGDADEDTPLPPSQRVRSTRDLARDAGAAVQAVLRDPETARLAQQEFLHRVEDERTRFRAEVSQFLRDLETNPGQPGALG